MSLEAIFYQKLRAKTLKQKKKNVEDDKMRFL